jgi:aspartyl-tRNA(Asn)/glutamyl-tRNA(Gln) amidotransferase subunit C
MQVTEKTVREVAHLARLEFEQEGLQQMQTDLNRMIGFVEKLNELNTDGVEPLIYLVEETNVLREDVASPDFSQKDALKNAPKKDSDYFKAPKVIDK